MDKSLGHNWKCFRLKNDPLNAMKLFRLDDVILYIVLCIVIYLKVSGQWYESEHTMHAIDLDHNNVEGDETISNNRKI